MLSHIFDEAPPNCTKHYNTVAFCVDQVAHQLTGLLNQRLEEKNPPMSFPKDLQAACSALAKCGFHSSDTAKLFSRYLGIFGGTPPLYANELLLSSFNSLRLSTTESSMSSIGAELDAAVAQGVKRLRMHYEIPKVVRASAVSGPQLTQNDWFEFWGGRGFSLAHAFFAAYSISPPQLHSMHNFNVALSVDERQVPWSIWEQVGGAQPVDLLIRLLRGLVQPRVHPDTTGKETAASYRKKVLDAMTARQWQAISEVYEALHVLQGKPMHKIFALEELREAQLFMDGILGICGNTDGSFQTHRTRIRNPTGLVAQIRTLFDENPTPSSQPGPLSEGKRSFRHTLLRNTQGGQAALECSVVHESVPNGEGWWHDVYMKGMRVSQPSRSWIRRLYYRGAVSSQIVRDLGFAAVPAAVALLSISGASESVQVPLQAHASLMNNSGGLQEVAGGRTGAPVASLKASLDPSLVNLPPSNARLFCEPSARISMHPQLMPATLVHRPEVTGSCSSSALTAKAAATVATRVRGRAHTNCSAATKRTRSEGSTRSRLCTSERPMWLHALIELGMCSGEGRVEKVLDQLVALQSASEVRQVGAPARFVSQSRCSWLPDWVQMRTLLRLPRQLAKKLPPTSLSQMLTVSKLAVRSCGSNMYVVGFQSGRGMLHNVKIV
jgi:hypothetical protein